MKFKNILSCENEENEHSNSEPRKQYCSILSKNEGSIDNKMFDTIVEEAESNESSILINNNERSDSNTVQISVKEKWEETYQSPAKTIKTNYGQLNTPVKSSSTPLFSSISTTKIRPTIIPYNKIEFKKSVFTPKSIYKNPKYWEWLNYGTKEMVFSSVKTFGSGNRIKRRRKDSEFASRQWSKMNGLSSLSLSKSLNYDSNKPSDQIDQPYQFENMNLYLTEGSQNLNFENEWEFDDDYDNDNMSIPFEWSLPNKEIEAFLKETQQHIINNEIKYDDDLKSFETFSPNFKDSKRQTSSQKDINTELLNRPIMNTNKDWINQSKSSNNSLLVSWKSQNKQINFIPKLSNEAEWNLKATMKSSEITNKPCEIAITSPGEKPTHRELELIKELESWKKTIKAYQDAYGYEILNSSK